MPHGTIDTQMLHRRRRIARRRYLVAAVALVLAWSPAGAGFWYYAAGKARRRTIDGWREREAKAGRIYTCGSQTDRRLSVPHRGALRRGVGADSRSNAAAGRAQDRAASWSPRRSISRPADQRIQRPAHHRRSAASAELSSPTGSSRSRACAARRRRRSASRSCSTGRWSTACSDGSAEPVASAKRIELHGRIVEGSAADNPVIELVLRLDAGLARRRCIRPRHSRSMPTSPRCCAA